MVMDSKNVKLTEELIKKFKEQETEAIYFDDYCKLAEIIVDEIFKLNLIKKGKGILGDIDVILDYHNSPDSAMAKKRFDDLTDSILDLEKLAELDDVLKLKLDDNYFDYEWVLKIYKNAERLAKTFDEYISLAKSIEDNLDDQKWSDKLRKQAEELKD